MTLHIVATIHHGDYFERFEVDASKASDLVKFFEQSTYMPRPETAEFKARQIWADLLKTGVAQFGWVDYYATRV